MCVYVHSTSRVQTATCQFSAYKPGDAGLHSSRESSHFFPMMTKDKPSHLADHNASSYSQQEKLQNETLTGQPLPHSWPRSIDEKQHDPASKLNNRKGTGSLEKPHTGTPSKEKAQALEKPPAGAPSRNK